MPPSSAAEILPSS